MKHSPKIVVFDLGGVMVRICHTWQEAVGVAGLSTSLAADRPVPLIDFPAFNAYQATEISEAEYLRALAEFTGVPVDRAIDVHNGILREPFPGIDLLVDRIQSAGLGTGCLSNTNAPHWIAFHADPQFSAVARLQHRAGSHQLGFAKPDPRSFQAYIDRFGLSGAEVMYFDDSAPNVEVAAQFGWHAHVVDPHGDPPAQMTAILGFSSPLTTDH